MNGPHEAGRQETSVFKEDKPVEQENKKEKIQKPFDPFRILESVKKLRIMKENSCYLRLWPDNTEEQSKGLELKREDSCI